MRTWKHVVIEENVLHILLFIPSILKPTGEIELGKLQTSIKMQNSSYAIHKLTTGSYLINKIHLDHNHVDQA